MTSYLMIEKQLTRIITHRWGVLLLLLCVVSCAFFPTFNNELMAGWDDQWQVVNVYTSSGFTWENMKEVFLYSYHGQYSPLNQCLYIMLYNWGGYTPVYYHAACLLIHLVNGWLVYLLLRRLLTHAGSLSCARICWISFGVSLLFCMHPLQVEAVAWVSASKILLSTSFYLLATNSFLSYLSTQKWFHFMLALFYFILAYGAKEQAVLFPLWLLLLCTVYGCDLRSRRLWAVLSPFFLFALVFGLFFVLETKTAPLFGSDSEAVTYTWWQRVVFSCYALFEYVWKWLFPYKLLYKYYYPMSPGEPLPLWLLAYPLLLVTFFCCFFKQLAKGPVRIGLLFYLVHIVLVLHLVPIHRQHLIADRYMYLASVGISFILVWYFTGWYVNLRPMLRLCFGGVVVCLFVYLGVSTYSRTAVWHDTGRLYQEIKNVAKDAGDMTATYTSIKGSDQ